MKKCTLTLAFLAILLSEVISAVPLDEQDDQEVQEMRDAYYNIPQDLPRSLVRTEDSYPLKRYKRSCIRRGGNCDHRPRGCCSDGSCRCNFWGTNCRCERDGF